MSFKKTVRNLYKCPCDFGVRKEKPEYSLKGKILIFFSTQKMKMSGDHRYLVQKAINV